MSNKSTERFGLVVTISVVEGINPLKTKTKSIFFENIEEGREFAKNHTTISKMLVPVAE